MNFSEIQEEKSKNETNSSFSAKKILLYVLCGILLLISTVVLITFIVIYVPKIYTENYAVVIDAGSTGSRAYLYKWKDSADEKNDIVTELSNCNADKLQNLDWTDPNNTLIQCISDVISDIPSNFLNRPYVYLASTAGMRLYASENPKASEVMFNNVKTMFEKKHWRTQYIGIISGELEGISAWITANFLKGTIGKDTLRKPTIGAMDLGGSSTQIAYESPSSKEKIDLYSYSYPIFSKSYLCYGTNMFYLKYMTYVALKSEEFHCLLKNAPVELKDDIKMCRYPGSENIDFKTVTKIANPNPEICSKQIRTIVNNEMTFTKTPPNAKFVAMSSYYYVFQFLKKYYNITNNITQFEKYTAEFCKENFKDIPKKFTLEQKYVPVYCVLGMYILELLKGYGTTDLMNVEFTDKIEGQSVGWNLGYMIDKTRSIPEAYFRKLNTSLFIAIVIIFSIIFVASIISLVYLIWGRYKKVEDINV